MFKALIYFLSIILWMQVSAQPKWKLVKNKNNIQVYAAGSDSSNLKMVKTVAVIDGSIEKLISIFMDIDHQKLWVYSTKQSYLIKKISEREVIYYVETVLPWPMKNRDVPIHMNIDEKEGGKSVVITTIGEPHLIPVTKGKIRVPQFYGKWDIKATSNNKLSIDYFLHVDPGGKIPTWIVNMFVSKGPYETVNELAILLKNN
jgi:hypothetical protein